MRLSVHTSDRIQFKWCRQRWDFASNLRMNLEPRATVTPLWFGTGIHLALATYYDPDSSRDEEKAKWSFIIFCKDWEIQAHLQGRLDDDRQLWLRDQMNLGYGMLDNYFKWAKKHDDFEVIWVEQVFDVEIPGLPGVTYRFRVDGLAERFGKLYILEHKTTAQFPDNTEWLLMDDQVGSYLWGLRQAYGIEAEGVVYTSLKKKAPLHLKALKTGGLSVNKSQDTTFEIALQDVKDYHGKVPKHYHAYLRYLRDDKPDNFVQREVVRRNQRELNMLGESIRYEIRDMLNSPVIYRSPSRVNCGNCPFVAPCLAKWEGADYEAILAANYKDRDNERL